MKALGYYVTWLVFLFCVGLVIGFFRAPKAHAEPRASLPYRSTLIREARAEWGLRAPVAVFAGQVEQESDWNPHACSPYACGLAQFTPATAEDMKPRAGTPDVFNPGWALRALTIYDHDLYAVVPPVKTECDRWAFTLASYNGGLGNVRKDRSLCAATSGCDTSRWFGGIACCSLRSRVAFAENRAYPVSILRIRQFAYATWGMTVPCSA